MVLKIIAHDHTFCPSPFSPGMNGGGWSAVAEVLKVWSFSFSFCLSFLSLPLGFVAR